MKHKFAVVIARGQPWHEGHTNLVKKAKEVADKVLILVGSSNRSRSPKNPFTFAERQGIILEIFKYEHSIGELDVLPNPDFVYNDPAWIRNVQKIVHEATQGSNDCTDVVLVGFKKDFSSEYLSYFPDWDFVNVDDQSAMFNATDIRNDYFRANPIISNFSTPSETEKFLREFIYTDAYKWISAEKAYNDHYHAIWKDAPFPVTIQCVDNVVLQMGHILLVTRKSCPGKGLLALPGGHINPNERLRDAAIRELREETGIEDEKGRIPPAKLSSFIEDSSTKTYDDPSRSERGRVITQVFKYVLPDAPKKYKVKGMDDAEHATWHSLGSLKAENFFEDHAFIIMDQLGIQF